MKTNIFRIVASTASDQPTDIYLEGVVGDSWDGFTAKSFIQSVSDAKPTSLRININSVGGDVFEGIQIYNFLKAQTIPVESVVTGVAASAATIIALGAKKTTMAAGAIFMIHNPSGGQWGQAADMRKTADVLDKIAGELATIYAMKTGKSQADMLALMDAETWMTGPEAMAAGFVDEVSTVEANIAASAFTGCKFKNAPARVQVMADALGFVAKSIHCEATPEGIVAELDSIKTGQEQAAERITALTEELGKVSGLLGSAEAEIKALNAKLATNPNPDAAAAKIVASMGIAPVTSVEATGKPEQKTEANIYEEYKAIKDDAKRFEVFQKHQTILLRALR